MRVHIGSDHAGFELKAHLLAHLASLGHDVVDVGPASYNAGDDYPPYCIATGLACGLQLALPVIPAAFVTLLGTTNGGPDAGRW